MKEQKLPVKMMGMMGCSLSPANNKHETYIDITAKAKATTRHACEFDG